MASLASLTAVLALGVCVAVSVVVRSSLSVPRLNRGKLALALLWVVLALLLWVSDYPAAWRVPEIVEYLSEVTLSAFRILCVTATGAVVFGSMVALLFYTRPRRR